jgi:hypothetical protein
MPISAIVRNSGFTAYLNGQTYTVDSSHPNYKELVKCLNTQDEKTFLAKVSMEKVVAAYVSKNEGDVEFKDEQIYYKGNPLHNVVTSRVLDMIKQGFNAEPMLKFIGNLMENPSFRSVQQLYSFLEHNNLPITPDGCFLAYKAVRENFRDKHSGKFDNSIGQVISMSRNEVDDNPDSHCSHGFHVGTLEYVNDFRNGNDKVVLVKVNPRDAVSVPNDHSCMKLRCCQYEVVEHFRGALEKPVHVSVGNSDYDYGDVIEFDYDGLRRVLCVDDVDHDSVFGTLHSNDHKYNYGESNYRNFKLDRMSNVHIIESYNDEYDIDDEEEESEDDYYDNYSSY